MCMPDFISKNCEKATNYNHKPGHKPSPVIKLQTDLIRNPQASPEAFLKKSVLQPY